MTRATDDGPTRSGAQPPNIADVARLAGVALGTVSNALNRPEKVAEPTRRKIQDAIDQLGFVPNSQARSLAAGRSSSMGFIVTDIGNSYFVDMVKGAESGAQAVGMNLLLANSDNSHDKQEANLNVFEMARFSGILLAPFEASLEGIDRVRQRGRKIVLLNVAGPAEDGCSVVVDNELGGYLAARHLIEIGRRRLAFVGGPDRLAPLLARREGAERAVAELRGDVQFEEIIVDSVNVPEGRAVGQILLERPIAERPDGIVAATDLLALGIIQTLTAMRQVRIPEDIAIIGYDNNSAARESSVPISTIGQPGFEIGFHGARLLHEEIERPDSHRHQVFTLTPHLIPRASTIGPAI